MNREQLWAPWRLAYIVQPKDGSVADSVAAPETDGASRAARRDSCFFCRYRDDPASDDVNYVLARSAHSIVLLNRFPYNNGHILVAPLAHKASLVDLTDDELTDAARWLRRLTAVLGETMNPDGFNIGLNLGRAAGAGVPGHLHWHIVPRWSGDTNFMAVLGDVCVIPQSLEALRDYLKPRLATTDGG